MSNLKVFW